MSAQYNQNWTRGFGPWFTGPTTDQPMRASDAERQAVADRLAEHFSSGRLDQAEFDERVSRAMAAKTRGDLDGLFDDPPDPEPPGGSRNARASARAVPYRPRRRSGFGRMLLLVVVVIAALSIVSHVLTAFAFYVPWFWIAALVAVGLPVNRSAPPPH